MGEQTANNHTSREKVDVGRPYQKDLENLWRTAEWADQVNITDLAASVARNSAHPLLAIGSGGSQSVACFSAMLHRFYTGRPGEEVTPLLGWKAGLRDRAVQMFTASGANVDILGCFSALAVGDPVSLSIISSALSSPVSRRAGEFWFTEYFGFDGPADGEGFVATHSILAQAILMKRAYEAAFLAPGESISVLLGRSDIDEWVGHLEMSLRDIGAKNHVLVLFDELGKPAAVDLESKFSEVGLASVQLADYRNFAHGRHNWLDKKGNDTIVFSIEIGEETTLAQRTVRLLPEEIAVLRMVVPASSHAGSLLAMYAAMRLTGTFGNLRRIDPGRPGVPPYGSKLYHLNAWSSFTKAASIPEIAVSRKSHRSVSELRRSGSLDEWLKQFWSFVDHLESTEFSDLVLDYDGTLCDQRDRFRGVSGPVKTAVELIIGNSVPITIITGRGRSMGEALRNSVAKRLWPAINIAYYNGSETHSLSFAGPLEGTLVDSPVLQELGTRIKRHPILRGLSSEIRRCQLTIGATAQWPTMRVHRLVSDMLAEYTTEGVRAVTSSHSVDILLSGVSKLNPLKKAGDGKSYLCIGDSGCWPGNDYELLQMPGSLSADETSDMLDRCWHISPAGWRNSQATLHYLSTLKRNSSGFQIDRNRLLSRAE